MRRRWGPCAAILVASLFGGGSTAAQSPAPASADVWAEVTGTATCTESVWGERSTTGAPFLLTGRVLTCTETASDPRVSGTSTVVRALQTWDEKTPSAAVGWGDYSLLGPDGSWTGRHFDLDSSAGISRSTTVAVGSGAYTGWTYARSATVGADGSVQISGVIYPDVPPPGFPVTLSSANPDEDLGPVPPVTEITPALTGTLKLGKARGAPATATIGAGGGSIAITKRTDPLAGLVLTLSPGAFTSDVAVSISSQPIKGHDFGPLISPASPLITVEAGGTYADDLITVRIPVRIPDGSFAMAFYLDAASGRLEGMPLVAEDATGLTIATRHFSTFFVSLIELAALPPIVDSGFRPGVDDWQFTNFGSFLEPDGHCSGQSVSAMYHYIERYPKAGMSHLFGLYDDNAGEPTPDRWQDDSDGYRRASMVQHDSSWDTWAAKLFINSEGMPDWLHRAAIRYAIAVTGEPQEIVIYDAHGGHGHAIVAYRVTRDFIQVADPNYPGQHRAIRWDEATQDLRPYSSGSNMSDIAASGTTAYTQILYAAKTAFVQWPQIAQRWSELDAGTIGAGIVPEYVLETQDATGEWVPLEDGYQAPGQSLTLRLRDPAARADLMLEIFQGLSSTPIATLKDQGSSAQATIDLAEGANALGFAIWGSEPAWTKYKYIDFQRLTVKTAPLGTMYTLRLRFDGGCDASFDGGYDAWSRVARLPVRINEGKADVDYAGDWESKHLSSEGQGAYDVKTGILTLPAFSASYTLDRVDEKGDPVTGGESLSASASGPVFDDPTIEFQFFPLTTSGSVDVSYPQLFPSAPTPDQAISCSASVTEANLEEGWVDVAP